MNCKQVENKILFYIDKELSDEANTSFEKHIASCQHCAGVFENVKSTLQVVTSEKTQAEDFYFYARLKQRMENRKLLHTGFNYSIKSVLQPIAVACLIAIGIFSGIKIGNQYNSDSINLSPEESRISELNVYSEETYIAEINNENMEAFFTSNQ